MKKEKTTKDVKAQDVAKQGKTSKQTIVDWDLIETVLEKLNSLLEQEAELLADRNYKEAVNLIDKKMDMIDFLNAHKKDMEEEYPTLDEDAFAKKKEKMRNLAQELLKKSKENMDNAKKAEYTAEVVKEILVQLMQEEKAKYKNYKYNAKKDADGGTPMLVNAST